MPTLRQNITYFYVDHMAKRKAALLRSARSLALIVLAALVLEVFLFNMNFFRTLGYEPLDLTDSVNLTKSSDGSYKFTESDHVLEFSGLDTEIHNVYLAFDSNQAAQVVTLKIQFTDEGHATYFDTTEYTLGVPDVDVSTNCEQSKYINLTASGAVGNLRIEVVNDDANYPLRISQVLANAHEPFDFSSARFTITLCVLLLLYMFRPRSAIYRIKLSERPVHTKAVIVAFVFAELLVMSSYFFMGSNQVGIATSSYNYGSWDGSSIVNTYPVGGENAQQYAKLARAIVDDGTLYLEDEPPDWLVDMDSPYDRGARDEAQKQTGDSYLFDVAYYDGHYYVYFGVVPVLLFYIPFYLATGQDFPTALGVLFAVVMFVLGCTALLDRFARRHFRNVSLGMFLLLQMPLSCCCGVLYLLKFPTFYSLPIACALAFSVWGLYFWMKGRSSEKPCASYLIGSLCMALVVGCRPQLVLLSFLAFPLFWRKYITEKRLFSRNGAVEFACLIAPYVVVAAGIMWYNAARFGSPLDFGANYNLTVNDMTKRGMNVGRLAPALFAYFFQPPSASGSFPFILPASFETTYMGQTIKEVTFGGNFACIPLLWVLVFSPQILRLRERARSTRTVMGVVVVMLIVGVVIALLDAEMAGILQRYFADFSFMFVASAVLLCYIVNESLGKYPRLVHMFRRVVAILVALSLLYSILVCFVPETGWYSDVYDWAYQDVLETAQFWT